MRKQVSLVYSQKPLFYTTPPPNTQIVERLTAENNKNTEMKYDREKKKVFKLDDGRKAGTTLIAKGETKGKYYKQGILKTLCAHMRRKNTTLNKLEAVSVKFFVFWGAQFILCTSNHKYSSTPIIQTPIFRNA